MYMNMCMYVWHECLLSCYWFRVTLVFLEIVVSLEVEVKEVKMENLDRLDE